MVTRRLLLAAATAALLPHGASGQPQGLRAQLGQLRLGANLERWYPVARDNRPRRLGAGWWREFRASGFDHVRMFLPAVSATGGGTEVPALFQQAVEDATGAGLVVLLGMADFYHADPGWDRRDWAALAERGSFLAPRADPGRVVLAPINEPVFPDAAAWMPVRDRLLAVLRQAAPRHLLMWGGHEWCSGRSLLPATPPADPATIAEVHDYEGGDAGAVRGRFTPLAAWRDRHRLPVLVTELGGAKGHETNRPAWTRDLRAALPVLRSLRLPATLWSYSHGGWWRMQPGDAAVPHDEVRGAYRP
jgi:hypothetical protein